MTSQRGQAMVGCYGGSSTDRNGGGVGVDAMALRERERERRDEVRIFNLVDKKQLGLTEEGEKSRCNDEVRFWGLL